MLDPFAGDGLACHEGTLSAHPRPVEALEIVRHELAPLDPAVRGAPVQRLHQLEGEAFDLSFGIVVAMVTRTGVDQHGAGLALEQGDERTEMRWIIQIVAGQVRDVGCLSACKGGVQGSPQPAILSQAHV